MDRTWSFPGAAAEAVCDAASVAWDGIADAADLAARAFVATMRAAWRLVQALAAAVAWTVAWAVACVLVALPFWGVAALVFWLLSLALGAPGDLVDPRWPGDAMF